MDIANLLEFVNRGLLMALWVSLPTVLAVATVGIAMALIQATTQLQDQTVSQVLKLVVGCMVMVLTARWAALSILNFADEMMRAAGLHAPVPIL